MSFRLRIEQILRRPCAGTLVFWRIHQFCKLFKKDTMSRKDSNHVACVGYRTFVNLCAKLFVVKHVFDGNHQAHGLSM